MKRIGTIAVAAILIAGCEPRPPHWGEECVLSHTGVWYMTTYNYNGAPTLTPQYYSVCDKSVRKCFIDPNYKKGPNTSCGIDPNPNDFLKGDD